MPPLGAELFRRTVPVSKTEPPSTARAPPAPDARLCSMSEPARVRTPLRTRAAVPLLALLKENSQFVMTVVPPSTTSAPERSFVNLTPCNSARPALIRSAPRDACLTKRPERSEGCVNVQLCISREVPLRWMCPRRPRFTIRIVSPPPDRCSRGCWGSDVSMMSPSGYLEQAIWPDTQP